MPVVLDRSRQVGEWVCSRLNSHFNADLDAAIGLEKAGRLVAGVVFDNYRGASICIHVAAEGGHWLTREFLRAVFDYAFNAAKVNKLIGPVDSTNESARRFDEHLGFVPEAILTGAGRTGDLILYTMTRQQCRFLKDIHGQAQQSA
jgi:RimJ/RimL family protein N-acetyltransferase